MRPNNAMLSSALLQHNQHPETIFFIHASVFVFIKYQLQRLIKMTRAPMSLHDDHCSDSCALCDLNRD